MGANTDRQIQGVIDKLAELQTRSQTCADASKSATEAWAEMMAAYDKGGRAASAKLHAKVEAAFKLNVSQATAAQTALTAATSALAAFTKYTLDKDKKTINPLAKKSMGKAKAFIKNCETELKHYSSGFKPPDLSDAVKAMKQYY